MLKYLLPLILLSSCSVKNITGEDDIIWLSNRLGDDQHFNYVLKQQVKEALSSINTGLKEEATNCEKIAQCIGYATYLHIDVEHSFKTECRLVGTKKQVSCSND